MTAMAKYRDVRDARFPAETGFLVIDAPAGGDLCRVQTGESVLGQQIARRSQNRFADSGGAAARTHRAGGVLIHNGSPVPLVTNRV